ncbi:MAG: Competence protein ComEA [Modestobacter sp.]|nr:Competence protein ComEA [Modestobacter sp.]
MRSSARRSDDDVIRARLRALLADTRTAGGWVPSDDDADDEPDDWTEEDDDERNRAEPGAGSEAGSDRTDRLPAGMGRHRAPGVTPRLDPGRPGTWALWAVGLLAAVAVAGWTWVDRPAVEQVPVVESGAPAAGPSPSTAAPVPAAPATGGTVVVSVVGQVASPGLVTLPAGSRVADALTAAGGLLPEADPAAVNAAALLTDGEQIAVGVPGAAAPAAGPAAGTAPGALLDLNSATVADLDALPGIGPVLAQRIVDHRTASGPFTSVDQLDDVSGIGPAIFAELAERVTV